MALESWMYGDPEKVAIRKEAERIRKEKACGNCTHKRSVEFKNEIHHSCSFKKRVYGTRCELFVKVEQL